MSGIGLENFTDAEVVALKFAYYRQQRDVFFRLQEKRARGEKINFKERGNEHLFTSAARELTPDELRQFCGSGYFLCEHLAGRTAVDWSFVVVPPDVQIGAAQAQQPAAAEVQQPPPAPAGALGVAAAQAREAKEFFREFAPPAPSLTREDVERAAEQAARRVAEQMKATQPAPAAPAARPLSLAEQAREIKDAATILGIVQPAATQQQTTDPTETFLQHFDRFTEISERISPPAESRGGVLGALESLMRFGEKAVSSPLASMLVSRLLAGQQGATPEANQAAAGANAPIITDGSTHTMLPPPLDVLMPVLVEDCTADAGPERAADAIESIVKAQPDYKQTLDELMSAPSIQIVQTVAQLSGARYLMKLPHSVAWFDSLKDELSGAGEDDEAGEAEAEGEAIASRNGDGR